MTSTKAAREGLEPSTIALTGRCTAIVLSGKDVKQSQTTWTLVRQIQQVWIEMSGHTAPISMME